MNRGVRLALPVAALVVVIDQLTKHWAVSSLHRGTPRHVLGSLQWNLTFNNGMAFSTGQGAGRLIGVIAIAVAAAVLWATRRQVPAAVALAAGLVVGGALGNVADRLFRGRGWLGGGVVDFIDLQWFPIFNVADMAVNVGAAVYLVWSLIAGRRSKEQA